MKHLLPIILLSAFLACLVACGGDDPVPPEPVVPIPSDTTATDSIVPDTVEQDSTEEDTTEEDQLKVRFYDYNYDQFSYTANVPRTVFEVTDQKGREVSMSNVKGDGVFRITASADGYVSQCVRIRNRKIILSFVLQPTSTSGLLVKEVAEYAQDLVLNNDDANRKSSAIQTTMLLPQGNTVRNADSKDTVSIVAFQPAGYLFEPDNVVGNVITGAVAGVAITPFDAQFSDGVEVTLTLPMSAEGYSLRIDNVNNDDEGTVIVEKDRLHFGAMYGTEWQVLMDARLVNVEKEDSYLLTNQVKRSEHSKSNANGKYNGYVGHNVCKVGYVAESDLNFMEERFLTSLFGLFYDKTGLAYDFYGNYPFVVEYNLKQEVYHLTFEAAGRQFSAKVYGETGMEILNIAPDNP